MLLYKLRGKPNGVLRRKEYQYSHPLALIVELRTNALNDRGFI